MDINEALTLLLEADKTYLNPKTGNRVGYVRAMQLGLIKPHETKPEVLKKPSRSHKVSLGHATGPKPKKDPNAPKAWYADFTKYKLNGYPVGIPQDKVKIDISGDVDTHAVMQWVSPKTGKTVSVYTKAFLDRNAEEKWKRISKIKPKDIQHISNTVSKILSDPNADDKLKQAAAIIGIIQHTGLRIGSEKGFGETGNRGVSTLNSDNVKISGSNITFNFIGKSYQENNAEIHDKALADYLLNKTLERKNSPFLFSIPKHYIDKVYDDYMGMEDFKIKDLRTYAATMAAKKILYNDSSSPPPLPANPKDIKNVVKDKLKNVFEQISQLLNNTPAMARTSYVHPKIIHDWLDKIGVKAVTVGYAESINEVNLRQTHALHTKYDKDYDNRFSMKETDVDVVQPLGQEFEEDPFEDIDFYALPNWWDNDSIQLVRK